MSIAVLPGLPVLPRKAKGTYCIWLGNVVSAPETADRILPCESKRKYCVSSGAHSLCEFNFIPFKYLFYHFMKTLPLALDALLCIGALLVPAFLASCREASERQDQIRFGLFPNVTHVQGLVARHFSRTGRDGLKTHL